jgi:hypothetical protein
MERRRIDNIREEYRDLLESLDREERALEVNNSPTYSPLLKVDEVHPEAEPDPSIYNNMINDIIFDTVSIDEELCNAALDFKILLEDTKLRLDKVKVELATEKERQQDINILCNQYSEFGSAINLTAEDFTGDFNNEYNVFSGKVISRENVAIGIVSIEGNGYEGNKNVYKDGAFPNAVLDTSNRKFLNDGSTITVYEYSRITASNTEKQIFSDVNIDSVEAKCTMTIRSFTSFNALQIASDSKDLILFGVSTSEDGVQFKETLIKPIELNNTNKKYEIQNYIPGSKLICFPATKYLKITLQSNSYTDEKIAFIINDYQDPLPDLPNKPVVPPVGEPDSAYVRYTVDVEVEVIQGVPPTTLYSMLLPYNGNSYTMWPISAARFVKTITKEKQSWWGPIRAVGHPGASFDSMVADFFSRYPEGKETLEDDGYTGVMTYGNPMQIVTGTDNMVVDFYPIPYGPITLKKTVDVYMITFGALINNKGSMNIQD